MYCDALNARIHFYGERSLAITTREVKQILTAAGKNLPVIGQIGFPWGDHEGRKELIAGSVRERLAYSRDPSQQGVLQDGVVAFDRV